MGRNDLMIAAHALASGATLVTSNEQEFSHVRGLKVESWV
jgi:tRNA(fMet)-specific endonuclease VapC